jgi:hypothetical protein
VTEETRGVANRRRAAWRARYADVIEEGLQADGNRAAVRPQDASMIDKVYGRFIPDESDYVAAKATEWARGR